uniref:Uncharacterized protein n=1 Tax=Opuntia streptacantha TaxID=393608 RepID=A0A7C8YEI8_OPUST
MALGPGVASRGGMARVLAIDTTLVKLLALLRGWIMLWCHTAPLLVMTRARTRRLVVFVWLHVPHYTDPWVAVPVSNSLPPPHPQKKTKKKEKRERNNKNKV